MIELYFSTVKILAQRPTHISAVATVLLITKTFTEKEEEQEQENEKEQEQEQEVKEEETEGNISGIIVTFTISNTLKEYL